MPDNLVVTVWTVGHSTRSSEAFVKVLEAHEIEAVLDVRRMPGSRRLPQFDSSTLAETLPSRSLWWRCHRRIIADVLTSIGERVEHIRDEGAAEPHRLMPPARVVGGELTYRQG